MRIPKSAMTARKRASTSASNANPQESSATKTTAFLDESPPAVRPTKAGQILKVSLLFFIPYFYLIFYHYGANIEAELKRSILINAALSFAGFFITLTLIPVASRYVLRRNMFGYDINKKGTPQGSIKVPESLGIVVGIVFLVLTILFQYFNFTSDSDMMSIILLLLSVVLFRWSTVHVDGAYSICSPGISFFIGKSTAAFSFSLAFWVAATSDWLVEYNAALASICFMILLGFLDDVLDIPWRVKLVLPSVAALPLLMAYAGHTTIIIPKPLVSFVGIEILDLGWLYKLYMGLLAVFCTNSINIHAGINGLEVGQTVVIASAILVHNIMQIGASAVAEYKQAHAFSIYLVQPLLATSLALLSYNWYPSSVFVGDTYTYFAGMTMAVVGILGHYSETLLIFFIPQVMNFLLSVPQLSGYIPCPRHRLPRFDPQTGLLTGTNDGTLVNLSLRLFGRMSEKSLCILLLILQIIGCCFCFILRWFLTGWYK